MVDPDTTLTDFGLALLCAVFAILLVTGTSGAHLFAGLFAALAVASLTGGLWHGWFSGDQSGPGGALWLATLIAVGAANLFLWLIAGDIAFGGRFAVALRWAAGLHFGGYLAAVLFYTRGFRFASINSVPPTLAVLFAYGWGLANGGPAGLGFGIAGILTAIAGAAMQMRQVALPALGLSHNGLYHVLQAVAFSLLYLSIPTVTYFTLKTGV